MDTSDLKLFSAMRQKLHYMGERQKVLAQNIANANTPGYKAKDLEKSFQQILVDKTGGVGLKTTNPKHIQPGSGSAMLRTMEIETSEITPTGNTVVIEEELLKMQDNNMEYQKTAELYRKLSQMLRMALGDK